MVCANICISGSATPRSWYLQPQTHDRGRDRTERILQAEEQILERDEEEPDISTRRLAAEVGVSHRCVNYSKWLLPQCRERLNFLKCILFTNEARFTRSAVLNSHNIQIWSDENPHARQEVHTIVVVITIRVVYISK
ncbi:hypothetical protein Zmor_007384 [Zophobas morio]|uniref:Uncharacterized protein n=1 Tax=Zophobas morio TaxID=2755281 RepID=A0AA38ITX2_9CUCU|nr:hypothetical protein Zmor_007384 [Zophobas morio]